MVILDHWNGASVMVAEGSNIDSEGAKPAKDGRAIGVTNIGKRLGRMFF